MSASKKQSLVPAVQDQSLQASDSEIHEVQMTNHWRLTCPEKTVAKAAESRLWSRLQVSVLTWLLVPLG